MLYGSGEGFMEDGFIMDVCTREGQVSWQDGKPERNRKGGCFSLIKTILRIY